MPCLFLTSRNAYTLHMYITKEEKGQGRVR